MPAQPILSRLPPNPMPRIASITLLSLSLSFSAVLAQSNSPDDPIADAKRREILDQSESSTDSTQLERYMTMVLLPIGGVLLLIWMLRASRHE